MRAYNPAAGPLLMFCLAVGACSDGTHHRGHGGPEAPLLPNRHRPCPDVKLAAHVGERLLGQARATMQMGPFEPTSAGRAIATLHAAVDCFKHAGNHSRQTAGRALLSLWQRRAEHDYAVRRLRLARSLTDTRAPDMQRVRVEALALLLLLPETKGPYVRWLRRLSGGAR